MVEEGLTPAPVEPVMALTLTSPCNSPASAKGNRPSFIAAGEPEHAKHVWLAFNEALRAQGLTVKEGRFGAHMRVSLVNDGPVTLVVDTADVLGK